MAELALQAYPTEDDDGRALVVAVVREHAPALLRTARRHSICDSDAEDAYQRAMEIFLRRASTLERATVVRWLVRVVQHEAMAIRRARQESVGREEVDLDAHEASGLPSDDERVLRFDRLGRSAEALARLKPQEVRALWLKAQGHSYQEIARHEGWSYTKTNRLISEGRRSFLTRYAGIESGAECRRWAPVLSAIVDGEASAADRVAVRPHLRHCPACRATVHELRVAGPRLAGVLPVAGLAGSRAAEGRHRLLGRLGETLFGGLQDRVAGSLVKLQAAADTASAGKVAAVASAAAALAGGGAVTAHETHVFDGSASRPHAARGMPSRSSPGAAATSPRAATATIATTATRAAAAATGAARSSHGTSTRRAARAKASRPHTTTPAASPASATDEFAVEPAGTAAASATATRAPVASSAGPARSAPAAPAAPAAARTSAPGDFGVESP